MHNDNTKILQEDHPNWQDRIILRVICFHCRLNQLTIEQDRPIWIPRRYPDE